MSNNISIKKATVIYGGAKYATIIIQLIISAVLSRLLTPKDYGIVAIVAVFTTLFGKFSNLGLGTAVTQYRDLSKQDIQDIFTFTEYFSVGLMVIFMMTAYPIAIFYKNMIYVKIVLLLSISVFFNSLNMIPNALLLKEKAFLKVGVRTIITTVGSGIVAIILAFWGAKYYALIIQSIISAFIQFVWNYKGTDLKIRFKFKYAPIKRVQSYSSNQFAYNIFNYFAQNLDNLLTGKIMGSEMLAFYNKGYTLMRYPVNNIAHVVTPILHPILSEYQNDKKRIYNEFLKVIKIMSLLGVFITVICFWADTEIVICYYGSQWYDAVPPFKWLSICVWVQLMSALFGSIYQSLGCTKQMLNSGFVHISISLVLIIVGASTKDITVLAMLVSVSMIVKFFVEVYFLIRKCFNYSVIVFLRTFVPEVIILIVMMVITLLIGDMNNMRLWQSLIVKMVISGGVYLVMVSITRQQKYLLTIIPDKIKRGIRKSN